MFCVLCFVFVFAAAAAATVSVAAASAAAAAAAAAPTVQCKNTDTWTHRQTFASREVDEVDGALHSLLHFLFQPNNESSVSFTQS